MQKKWITDSSYEIKGEFDDGETGGFQVILTLPEEGEGNETVYALVSKIYEDDEGEYFRFIDSDNEEFPESFDGALSFYKSDEPLDLPED